MLGFPADGPSAETMIDNAVLYPGDTATGRVCLRGGQRNMDVDRVVVGVVTSGQFVDWYRRQVEPY